MAASVVRFEMFSGGTFVSWNSLFTQAAEFASTLYPSQVISISHSESSGGEGIVTVWYWDTAPSGGRGRATN